MDYSIVERGIKNTPSYCIYLKNQYDTFISPLHDIPLYANPEQTILNMIVRAPRWENAAMNISLKGLLNPIVPEIKDDQVHYIASCFPHKGYCFNYGCFPQTLQDEFEFQEYSTTAEKRSNQPIDVLELGNRVATCGEVIQVKALGAVAIESEGDYTWKVFAIDIKDPGAQRINDIEDLQQFMPGIIKSIVHMLKVHTLAANEPENKVKFSKTPKDAFFVAELINLCHQYWQFLLHLDEADANISCCNTSLKRSSFLLNQRQAVDIVSLAPNAGVAKADKGSVNKWHYLRFQTSHFQSIVSKLRKTRFSRTLSFRLGSEEAN